MGSSAKATGTSKLARTAKNRSALSSTIEMRCHHAYLEQKLNGVGAQIERIS